LNMKKRGIKKKAEQSLTRVRSGGEDFLSGKDEMKEGGGGKGRGCQQARGQREKEERGTKRVNVHRGRC